MIWRVSMGLTLLWTALLGPATLYGAPAAAATGAAPDCRLPPTQQITHQPWAQRRLDVARVWPLTEGAGIVVAVVDTGVKATHPMLAGRVLPGVDVVSGGGPAWTDCHGHGTFVAGIIAAGRVDGVGFAGIAPAAIILPLRQTEDGNDGTATTLAAAIVAAVDRGATVINVSITIAAAVPALEVAVRYAYGHDALIVAAAGNDAQQGDAAQYPAAYPGVLAVGAIGPDDRPTNFTAGESGVSVVAPGSDILSLGAGGDGLVAAQQGTSFAAPFVSGVAALVRAYHPGLSADQVKHRIEATADHPPSTLPDLRLGWGVVNPYRAVTAVLPEEQARAQQTQRTGGRLTPLASPAEPPGPGRAVSVAGTLLVVAGGVVVCTAIVRHGRRRGWRPAERHAKS